MTTASSASDPRNDNRLTLDQVEARMAGRLARWLDEAAEAELAPGVAERLQFARETAVARARAQRLATANGAVVAGAGGGSAALGGFGPWWTRLAVWLPALVLAGGFYLLTDAQDRQAALVAAEVDAQLLADDLPPAAYADPGFVAFLKLQQP